MKTWFWICWFLILKCVCAEQRSYRIIIEDIRVRIFDTETVDKFGCQVKQINNRSYVYCQVLLNFDVAQVFVRTTLDLTRPNNGQPMKIYDARLNGCLFVESVHKNRVFNIYAKRIKQFSNFKCPLKAHYNYTLDKLYLDEKELPSFVPIGKYRAQNEFYLNQSFIIVRLTSYAKVISTP
ncbi:uncharacterized protein LOC122320869 [Drosophila ficusphila]|uniref:uncharacterized protein LOC122320869 n=1 Tax=Drosophila ficusphila TaxID=30025 RepID=UPI001C896278|nr:uncharacterized protein LOC122320869 [Drosophila ficusphila]